ncbi:RNA polymerase sigma factor [Enhygromyxa salina]|uniref:RNA polymerase sigma factor n=1 Tax=Enhygromyxa salina TaxID=215803 RepID=A0A2S9XJU8_9BACT|nr:sigma-70 family RNA polymerase sigma factor [Enhygromyxa salina]PRP93144.1 RNA polymerase sigma factor [Enhygromyxa salina]
MAVKLDPAELRRGNPAVVAAFEAILRRRIRAFFRKQSQVNVLTNTALMELLDKLARGEQPSRPLYRALNAANNVVRRELTRLRRVVVSFDSQLHSHTATPDASLGAREELERIDTLLEEVDEVPRQILAAAARGHTHVEIAAEFGISPGAARASLSRLRAQLRGELASRDQLDKLRRLAREAGLIPNMASSGELARPESSSS